MATIWVDFTRSSDGDGTPGSPRNQMPTSLSPGDEVRIAKSPDPVQVASSGVSWTFQSRVVTLPSSVTQMLAICDGNATGNGHWSAVSGKATIASNTSQYKLGTEGGKSNNRATQITVNSGAGANTLVAYVPYASALNLSGYRRLSCWVYVGAAVSASSLKLCTCSNNDGTGVVDEFTIPSMPAAAWYCFTLDKGSAMGSSIQSLALYTINNPGSNIVVTFDDIIACTETGLNLMSVISPSNNQKGTAANAVWYPVKSINGTTVCIDAWHNGGAGSGYSGSTTSNAAMYAMDCIRPSLGCSSPLNCPNLAYNGTVITIPSSGSSSGIISYSGGWDLSSQEQTGATYIATALRNVNSGLVSSGKSYIYIGELVFVGFNYSFNLGTSTATDVSFGYVGQIGCSNNPCFNVNPGSGGTYGLRFSFDTIVSTNSSTVSLNGTLEIVKLSKFYGYGTMTSASGSLYILAYCNSSIFDECVSVNSNSHGLMINIINDATLRNVTVLNQTQFAFAPLSSTNLRIRNFNTNGAVIFARDTNLGERSSNYLSVERFGGTDGDHRIYWYNAEVRTDTTTVYGSNPRSWRIMPKSNAYGANLPVRFKAGRFAVNANKQVTVTAQLRRDNSGLSLFLVCPGGQIAGVSSDVSSSAMSTTNQWEQKSISFTPTAAGVVEIEVWAYGGTTNNGYLGQLDVTQED